MNTSNLKKYAPQARRDFKDAVTRRLNALGISTNSNGHINIIEPQISGSVLQIGSNNFDVKINSARNRLINHCNKSGLDAFVEHVAYTWFNRLCAIRYMELHDYLDHGFRVLSHPNSPTSFEILDHAQDVAEALGLDRSQLIELKLAGNKDEELYRELLLGQCHALHVAMPFLFEALDDEAELLLPDNLTRTDSLIRRLIDEVPEKDWEQVEVIGWLYQFYISEKKDQVIGKVVKSEDIPAATQLFTPNWIVKYLVQNSVGRHWLQTYPESGIKSQMEYYIEPAEQSPDVIEQLKAITPESIEPESIKVLDPACGSGHILIEAYNVLKAIYEERGFRSRDIPKMILENNLYGLDIDDRAAQLAGFALMMMARNDDKRIFTRNIRLNVLSLQESNDIDLPAQWRALNLSGSWQQGNMPDLFADEQQDLISFNADNRYQLLKRTLERFIQAKTFGSLIEVPTAEYDELKCLLQSLRELQVSGDSMQKLAAKLLIAFVHPALVLSILYDSVVANPPYMGSKGMNADLKDFANKNYPSSKSDLFAIFIERAFRWLKNAGFNSMVTMQSWMFLSSYEQMRESILTNRTIENMVHMGNGVMKIAFGTNATVFRNLHVNGFLGSFSYADNDDINHVGVPFEFPVKNNRLRIAASDDFKKIPGCPIAYWAKPEIINSFEKYPLLENQGLVRQGASTSDNTRFLRLWFEVSIRKIGFNTNNLDEASKSEFKWFPYNKGGEYRKWYGNHDFVINYENNGKELKDFQSTLNQGWTARLKSREYYFSKSVSWPKISSGSFSARFYPDGFIFDVAGCCYFPYTKNKEILYVAFLNSKVASELLKFISPTLNFEIEQIKKLPFNPLIELNEDETQEAITISKEDWDYMEVSWNFKRNFLIEKAGDSISISQAYKKSRHLWSKAADRMKTIEEENNRTLINQYDLSSVISPEVQLHEISLMCNPKHRYGNKPIEEIEDKLLSDTICELLSYSIGSIMGRYSMDRDGIVYANSGNEGFADLIAEGAYATYPADDDGIIPLTDQEWFKDDATNRFREFVKVVWGEEHLQENLDFVAESLCLNAIKPKKSEPAMETIRRYLSIQFYKDHLKTYKKRPIYWLFSSGKQKAFECLVYLHRYNEGTLSRMRTEYVTPLLGKYDSYIDQLKQQIENGTSTAETNRLKKEQDAQIKKQVELREFDDKLKHYADMRISLDLDDGVKVNYGKFGDLLSDVKAITGSDSGAD